MLKDILDYQNLHRALQRVEKNKGSHGIDQMPTTSLREHLLSHWSTLRAELTSGTYIPDPVRRVEIPKPSGGKRKLGIPTVTDRFLQQALAQALSDMYDPTFSANSYGFRPGKRGHDAVRKAKSYLQEGYRWVIDLDLEKFFDTIHHDRLMRLLSSRITDRRVLRMIRRYLQAGVMEQGLAQPNTEGAPQGGPLSPILSNIVLDELDKELEARGLRFVRYADDCNIYVKSKRAGQRVMASITTFIEKTLQLKVNREKSAVDRPWKRTFLGFSFTPHRQTPKVRIAKRSLQRFKSRVRELTNRRKSMGMTDRLEKLNRYLVGWLGYYQLTESPSVLRELDGWIRRRLRMIRWKEWKQVKTKYRNLRQLGVSEPKAWEWANSRKGYWRIAQSPILHKTLGDSYWNHQGLKSLRHRYHDLRST